MDAFINGCKYIVEETQTGAKTCHRMRATQMLPLLALLYAACAGAYVRPVGYVPQSRRTLSANVPTQNFFLQLQRKNGNQTNSSDSWRNSTIIKRPKPKF